MTTKPKPVDLPIQNSRKFQIHSLWEILALAELEEDELNRKFRWEHGQEVLVYIPKDYPLEVWRTETPESLIALILHLSDKSWMTTEVLGEIIRRIVKLREFELYPSRKRNRSAR